MTRDLIREMDSPGLAIRQRDGLALAGNQALALSLIVCTSAARLPAVCPVCNQPDWTQPDRNRTERNKQSASRMAG